MILLIGAVLSSKTEPVREYAGRQATQALRRELGLLATIGAVEVDPLHLSVVVADITLEHAEYGRTVRAARLRIRPSWRALIRGQLDLHDITIEQATVWLIVRDGAVVNLPALPESAAPDEGPTRLEVPFNFIHIVDSRLVVDAAPLAHADMGSINVRLDGSHEGELSAELTAWDGWVDHLTGRDILSAIELSAVLTHDTLQVDLARIATPDIDVSVRRADIGLPLLEQPYRGKVELELDVSKLLQWPHGWELPDLQGQLHVEALVRGDRDGPTAEGHVELDGGEILWYGLGEHLELDVKVHHDSLTFRGFTEVLKQGGRVDMRGQLGFGEGLPLDAYADIKHVSFAKLMETLDVSENAIIDWDLIGNWTLRGTLDPLDLSGPMKMPTRNLKVTQDAYHHKPSRHILGVSSAMLDGTVAIRPAGLSFEKVDITLPNSKLFADMVLLGFDNTLRVRATAVDLDLQDVTPLLNFPLAGRGSVDFWMGGTYLQPTLGGEMQLDQFAFNTYPFGDIAGDFELEPSLLAVHFDRIDAKKRDSSYTIEGLRLDFADDKLRIDSTMKMQRLTLADFYDTFHWEGDERYDPYQGEVRGEATVRYTSGFAGDSPSGTMLAQVDLEVPHANIDGYALNDGKFAGTWHWFDHSAGYRGGDLTIDHFAMKKGKGTVSLSGKMSRGGALDLVVVADRIRLKDTEGFDRVAPGLDGSYGITGDIKGTAALPRVNLDVVANELRMAGEDLGDGRFYVRLTDKSDPWIQAAADWDPSAPPEGQDCARARTGFATASWPPDPPLQTSEGPLERLDAPMAFILCGEALEGALRVDMMVGRAQTLPLRGDLRFDDFALGKLLRSTTGTGTLDGTLSGRVSLRGGALLRPSTLVGDVDLSTLRAGQLDVELRNNGPVRLSFDRGKFQIDNATFIGPASQLYISGGGDLKEGLAVTVDGHVDLGLLAELSSSVQQASGGVDLHFKVSGAIDKPHIYGTAGLHQATLRLDSFDEPIDALQGNITFSAQRILFEGFRAQLAGGHVRGRGVAVLQGHSLGSVSLDLEGDHLDLSPRDGIDLRVGGRGTLAWKRGGGLPRMTGTLRLEEFVYRRPIKMGRTLGEMVQKERADAQVYDPEQDLVEVDLAVVQTKPLFIENNLIDAELMLRSSKQPFRLVGTNQRYGVLGNMSVRKGVVRFRDSTFNIRQGDIAFTSRTRIDPSFDILAVTDIRRQGTLNNTDWHITIHAWGNRDSFQFQLQSDPYLTEDDIALLLTVGMTHSELAQVQTGDLTGTAALEALATVSGVEREVQRALPEIDDFRIASAYSNTSNRSEPQLFIGKRLNDRVRLSASTGLSESRDFSTGVQLQLTDETSVEAVYNNQNAASSSVLGDVGVDLKWRLEFD